MAVIARVLGHQPDLVGSLLVVRPHRAKADREAVVVQLLHRAADPAEHHRPAAGPPPARRRHGRSEPALKTGPGDGPAFEHGSAATPDLTGRLESMTRLRERSQRAGGWSFTSSALVTPLIWAQESSVTFDTFLAAMKQRAGIHDDLHACFEVLATCRIAQPH